MIEPCLILFRYPVSSRILSTYKDTIKGNMQEIDICKISNPRQIKLCNLKRISLSPFVVNYKALFSIESYAASSMSFIEFK